MSMSISAELRATMAADYRHLHGTPELSMQEHNTAAFIEGRLSELGIGHFRCGGTGVVGILRNGPGATVAFRADMDGLPLQEATGLEFASKAMGAMPDGTAVPLMHGCGHDFHVTALLAAAEVMAGSRDAWGGTVVLVFQPGEETAAGARAMVQDGLWEKAPRPEVIFGQHVMPIETGTIHLRPGATMAQADSWKVTLPGKGSHASQPQNSIDPIVLGAHIVTRIQGIISREISPQAAAVVTVATFHAGLKENIIPASAEFTLNVRTFDHDVRKTVLQALRRIINGEAAVSGAPEPVIEELYTFPLNHNDPDATDLLGTSLRQSLGSEQVIEGSPLMGSEDFGLLGTALGVPSVFWFFGGYSPKVMADPTSIPVNHSPQFAPVMGPTLTLGATAAITALMSRVGIQQGGRS